MEFAYNNAPSATTGVSPFFANKGYHPNLSVYPERDITSSYAHNFVLNLDELQDTLKEEIAKAQRRYQPSTDFRQQQPPDFQVEQLVFVRSQYFRTTRPSETLQKVPRTIRDNCPAQSAILHTLPSGYHEDYPSCIPYLYAQTSHTQHLPVALRTSASTSNHRQRTRI